MDSQLSYLIECWAQLPESTRSSILRMIDHGFGVFGKRSYNGDYFFSTIDYVQIRFLAIE